MLVGANTSVLKSAAKGDGRSKPQSSLLDNKRTGRGGGHRAVQVW